MSLDMEPKHPEPTYFGLLRIRIIDGMPFGFDLLNLSLRLTFLPRSDDVSNQGLCCSMIYVVGPFLSKVHTEHVYASVKLCII